MEEEEDDHHHHHHRYTDSTAVSLLLSLRGGRKRTREGGCDAGARRFLIDHRNTDKKRLIEDIFLTAEARVRSRSRARMKEYNTSGRYVLRKAALACLNGYVISSDSEFSTMKSTTTTTTTYYKLNLPHDVMTKMEMEAMIPKKERRRFFSQKKTALEYLIYKLLNISTRDVPMIVEHDLSIQRSYRILRALKAMCDTYEMDFNFDLNYLF